jgi:hypothetical protein
MKNQVNKGKEAFATNSAEAIRHAQIFKKPWI